MKETLSEVPVQEMFPRLDFQKAIPNIRLGDLSSHLSSEEIKLYTEDIGVRNGKK